jgi:hypothetical protein
MKRVLLALGLSACTSFTFDSSAPEIPLVGTAPATTSLPRLNQNPASNLAIIGGANSTLWASFQETVQQPDGSMIKGVRNRNLDGDGDEFLNADHIDRYYYGFYMLTRHKDAMPPYSELVIHTPGASVDDQFPSLPGGSGKAVVGGASDNIFIWLSLTSDATSFSIYRRDMPQLPLRAFNLPNLCTATSTMPCTDPTDPQSTLELRYQFGATQLFWLDQTTGDLSWHGITRAIDQDLGTRPQMHYWWVDETDGNVLACGDDGLRQIPLDNSGDKMLDTDPCTTVVAFLGGQVIYAVGPDLRKVSLTGQFGPTKILDSSKRLIGTWGNDRLFYSTDPANRYINSVGDGWLTGVPGMSGDWKFMTRGGDISLFASKELRWIDYAAQMSGIGDLYWAPLGGTGAPLARNVSEYASLPDGRILIEENHADRDITNRVVVLDEKKQYKRWVAQQASSFNCIDYACSDVLVDVVSGATGYDIVRVAVPGQPCDMITPPGLAHPEGACNAREVARCDHLAGQGLWDCQCSSGNWVCHEQCDEVHASDGAACKVGESCTSQMQSCYCSYGYWRCSTPTLR